MKLKRNLTQKLAKKVPEFMFIGKIVPSRKVGQEEQILLYFEDEEHIRFYVECLSPIPLKLQASFSTKDILFAGTTANKNNESKINPFIKGKKKEDDLESFKKAVSNKVVLFRFELSNEVLTVDIIEFIEGDQLTNYCLLPVVELRNESGRDEVENRLIKGSLPIHLPKYYNDYDEPEFIYYEGRVYGNLLLKSMMNDISYLEKQNQVRYIDQDSNESFETSICYQNLLYFIPEKDYIELKKFFQKESKELLYTQTFEHRLMIPNEWLDVSSEIAFFERFYQNCIQQGLLYNRKDLFNFHICCKFQSLTILGGVSGTGKSQLARVYGETLGLELGQELLFIPISPSYREHYDLLGYLNPSTGIFIDSETGLTKLLIEAEKFPHRLYMVIFDEMNLSQIEHWFSKFLSILELPEEDRILTLFHDHNVVINQYYKSKIHIGKNIIFVGTVNFDETSKEFSLRLLDRVNIISLKPTSFKRYSEVMEKENIYESIPLVYINGSQYEEWKKNISTLSNLSEKEVEFFDQFNSLLMDVFGDYLISPRMIRDLSNYLGNLIEDDSYYLLTRQEAIDYFIKQRVLTKIRGLVNHLESLVGTIESDTEEGSLFELFSLARKNNISEFELSFDELKRKRKLLEIDGYVN
ncbi:hypothetical protein J5Y03_19600 [Bacillus sp. RG28]|uniref:ATPase dynein-related AAA domain-containing protein n=1 Tax=Gottfriedia endophytica TaxID=2820819 RepID=A0A940NS97_9BACI|nr:hypothetical protein [Gottfriedia endophytica]MBP0727349.1 hypothetical protein [Gottfriedia endophytica]